MESHIDRVLISREAIAQKVRALAERIAADLKNGDGEEPRVTIVSILTGSLIFLADLIRQMPLMMRIRLITVTSYPGKATSSQGPRLESSLPDDLAGQKVLLVDDILDSGKTLSFVRDLIAQRNPASVHTCVLLRKKITGSRHFDADYVGFEIPDEFVVGYGLDYDGRYRNLPEIVTLKPEVLR